MDEAEVALNLFLSNDCVERGGGNDRVGTHFFRNAHVFEDARSGRVNNANHDGHAAIGNAQCRFDNLAPPLVRAEHNFGGRSQYE